MNNQVLITFAPNRNTMLAPTVGYHWARSVFGGVTGGKKRVSLYRPSTEEYCRACACTAQE